MKITVGALKQVIKEELTSILSEGGPTHKVRPLVIQREVFMHYLYNRQKQLNNLSTLPGAAGEDLTGEVRAIEDLLTELKQRNVHDFPYVAIYPLTSHKEGETQTTYIGDKPVNALVYKPWPVERVVVLPAKQDKEIDRSTGKEKIVYKPNLLPNEKTDQKLKEMSIDIKTLTNIKELKRAEDSWFTNHAGIP